MAYSKRFADKILSERLLGSGAVQAE